MIDQSHEWYIRASYDEDGNINIEHLSISPVTGKWEITRGKECTKEENDV